MIRYIIAIFLLTASAVQGKEHLKKELLERIIQPKISVESFYLKDSNIEGYDGSVSLVKNKFSINNKILGLSYTNSSFSWSNIDSLPFGNPATTPIKQIHAFKVNVNLPYKINEKWFLLNSVSLKSTFEKETNDSYGVGVFSFASYKLNDNHTFQLGAFMNYHPTETLALPILSYSYRARKSDGLQVVLGFPRTYIGYYYNKNTLLRLGVVYSQSLVRLSNKSTIELSGYIETKDYMSNVGIAYEFNDSFMFNLDILYSIKRDFIIYNQNSSELNKHSIDPTLGLSAKLSYRF